jgi:hypothetical protein
MLVVTTTVRMVDGVHSNTTSTGPAKRGISTLSSEIIPRSSLVTLGLEFVVCSAGFEQWLINTSTTGNDTNGSTGGARDGLLGARGKTDAGLIVIWRVADDSGVVARGSGKGTAVANLLLDVADDGTFWALSDGENISDVEGGLLATVDEGTRVETFSGDESLFLELVFVWVAEDNAG